jgi:hypothetical protein
MDPLDSTAKPDGELDTAPTMDDHDVASPVASAVAGLADLGHLDRR